MSYVQRNIAPASACDEAALRRISGFMGLSDDPQQSVVPSPVKLDDVNARLSLLQQAIGNLFLKNSFNNKSQELSSVSIANILCKAIPSGVLAVRNLVPEAHGLQSKVMEYQDCYLQLMKSGRIKEAESCLARLLFCCTYAIQEKRRKKHFK